MDAQKLQNLRREVELAQKHGTTPDISAWDLFEVLNIAERAVSPAESVQSIDTPEFKRIAAKFNDAGCLSAPLRYDEMVAYINTKIAAAHTERQTYDLSRYSETIALYSRLNEEKMLGDRAKGCEQPPSYYIRNGICYALQALLAQPLQQEGGKEAKPYCYLYEWDGQSVPGVIRRSTDYCKVNGREPDRAIPLYTAPQPHDNLQQTSTAQAEPAKETCKNCGRHAGHEHGGCDWKSCPANYPPARSKEAASATDAGQTHRWNGGTLVERLYNDPPSYSLMVEAGAEIQVLREQLRAATPAQATPEGADLPQDERAAFEAWQRKEQGWLYSNEAEEGTFQEDRWIAWQARAALASAAAANAPKGVEIKTWERRHAEWLHETVRDAMEAEIEDLRAALAASQQVKP